MKKQLGCLSGSGLITAVAVVLVVMGMLWLWGGVMFSPGPLNAQTFSSGDLGGVATHAELGHRCEACHVAPWSRDTMSGRCQVCHTDTTAELTDPASLHGAMMINGPLPCQECHTDHNGPAALMTIIDPHTFPHTAATGYALDAHHEMSTGETLVCADCHGDNITTFNVATCDTCHRNLDAAFTQAHIEAFGPDCMACHDGLERYGAAWTHALTTFPLDGGHAETNCADCHQGQHTQSALQSTAATCAACHVEDDAHQGSYGQDCAACHITASWEESTFSHGFTTFPLTGAHATTPCTQCHLNNVYQATPAACSACHAADDAHNGQFGQQCEACHTSAAWQPASYNGPHPFPMNHGASQNSPCATCHPDSLETYTCYGCHEHTPANIAGEHLEEGIRDFEDCVACHADGREGDD